MRKKALIHFLLFLSLFMFISCGASSSGSSSGSYTLTQVSGFGSNPGNLEMFMYEPSSVNKLTSAPLVVLLHGCSMSAQMYSDLSGWNKLADTYGFYVLYAQTNTSNNSSKCFTWFYGEDIERGSGEALSIKEMVDYMKSNYYINTSKVYISGLSAGGYMTSVMLATYPDVFEAGAVLAGGPYKCLNQALSVADCMAGTWSSHSPANWASLITQSAPYPRLLIFHGTADTRVYPANMTELMEQFTQLHGTDQIADTTTTVSGATYKEYKSGSTVVVATYLIPGMGHAIPVDPGNGETQGGTTSSLAEDHNLFSSYYAAKFFKIIP